jgi:hypothetical protein
MHVYFSTRRGNSGRFSATELLQFCVTAGVVVAPDRDFSSDCFLELASLSTFWREPGRNALGQTQSFANGALGKQDRNGDSWRSVRGDLDGEFVEEKAGLERLLKVCPAEFLMCVLASVRIFPDDCFLGVMTNSVCGAVPVRSVLDHLRIRTEISEFWELRDGRWSKLLDWRLAS